jgi:hypothetical protein
MGISKLTCTLKGEVPPKWSLDEDASVVIDRHLKDVGKILHHFIPLSRESLLKQQINRIFCSIIFIFFHHGGFLGHAREFSSRETSSRPNFLYSDLVGDMH